MPIFALRRYSRNNNSTASSRRANQQPTPAVPAASPISTPRPPPVTQTNLNFNPSSTQLASTDDFADLSSSGKSSHNISSQKPRLGAHILSTEAQESISVPRPSSTMTTRSGRSHTVNSTRDGNLPTAHPTSARSTYSQNSDLYTHNALNSFSFGAPHTVPSSSRPLDPLSQPRDDAESDEFNYRADTTPRPSVVESQSPPRSHSSQAPRAVDRSPPFVHPPRQSSFNRDARNRARRNSNVSTHTFGTSSASASATSLSSAAVDSSAGSRSGCSTTTPQTSANELTSDEENGHLHPIPLAFSSLNSLADNYVSDEELDDDSDFDHDDYEPDIDISSEIHEGSDRATYFDHKNESRESFRTSYYGERRGSLAIAVPQTPSSKAEGHNRDLLAGLRSPSQILEDIRMHGPLSVNIGSSRYFDDRPLPPAPTSVPGSGGDWRDMRRRSIQKENQTALFSPSSSNVNGISLVANKSSTSLTSAPLMPLHNTVLDDFDSSWKDNFQAGIVVVELDQSEMADFVGNFQGPRTSERNFRRGSSSTTESGRRLSTTSTSSDPFTRNLNKWGGQQYIDERMKWTFVREKADRLGEQRIATERERNSISSFFNPRSSISAASSMIGSSSGFHDGHIAKEREKALGKEKEKSKDQTAWKGMAIDAEEWWSSYTNGRYKVIRKSMTSPESGKPPQQRLNISHHRTPYSHKRDLSDGPGVTIHKHSKAIGFSISRHYRTRPIPHSSNHPTRTSTSSQTTTTTMTPVDHNKKKSSNMILLAPRKVQEAFTSTTTTRKLESHGFLNENGRQSPRDIERLERLEREKRERKKQEKEREKREEKEKKKAAQEMQKVKDRTKAKTQQSAKADGNMASSSESSSGSVTGGLSGTESATLVNGPSAATTPIATNGTRSIDYSVMSGGTSSSGRTITWKSQNYRLNDDFDDDDFDDGPKPPSRTPHPETYATLPAEAFESFALQQESHSHSIFSWPKSRGSSTVNRHIEKSYDPPWAVAQARFHPDARKGIVEDLNTSFQDVGLLPAVDEVKGSHSMPHRRKRQQQQQQQHRDTRSLGTAHAEESQNIFHSFSPDFLYMLLPLWPGETDQVSTRKSSFRVPHIPTESRQYLLMYYKPAEITLPAESENNKSQRESKKRSHNSPTSSRDSISKQHEKNILCDKFHISARIVSYSDIQGSGIRSPDVGLSVQGPLSEAHETMPNCCSTDNFQVIGICQSREKGVEFVPEGLETLCLTRRIPDPNATKEEEDQKRLSVSGVDESDEGTDSTLILTPIGRAVVEMAWLGSMALTSFGHTS